MNDEYENCHNHPIAQGHIMRVPFLGDYMYDML